MGRGQGKGDRGALTPDLSHPDALWGAASEAAVEIAGAGREFGKEAKGATRCLYRPPRAETRARRVVPSPGNRHAL